jgi:hypothetical protein
MKDMVSTTMGRCRALRRARTCSGGATDHQAELDSLLDILLPAGLEHL